MRVVTFGELMVRLQPFNYERFVQANNLEFSFGGGEANVAVSLANYPEAIIAATEVVSTPNFAAIIKINRKYKENFKTESTNCSTPLSALDLASDFLTIFRINWIRTRPIINTAIAISTFTPNPIRSERCSCRYCVA